MKVVVDHSKPLLNTLWLRDLDVSEHDGFESSLNIARISISAPNLHYFSDTSWPLESHPEIFNLLQNNFDLSEQDVMWLPTNWCARAWICIRFKCLWNMHDLKIYENLMETILMINKKFRLRKKSNCLLKDNTLFSDMVMHFIQLIVGHFILKHYLTASNLEIA